MVYSTYGYGMMYGGYGWFMQLCIIALVIFIIWWIVQHGGLGSKLTGKSESAQEILNRRLASGEITKKEFASLKKEMKSDD